jgi:hypothetical protein
MRSVRRGHLGCGTLIAVMNIGLKGGVMPARTIDTLAKALAHGLPRRGLLQRACGGVAAALALRQKSGFAAQDEAGRTVPLRCEPCFCVGDECECCLSGIAGGGVVATAAGDVQFVLFASVVGEGSSQAAGFVRWLLPSANDGQGTLESVGPLAYEEPQQQERVLRGTMQVDGSGQHPFVLRLVDAGPDAIGEDTAALLVGTRAATDGAVSGYSYEGEGRLVAGDLQLLSDVAPVPGA